MIRFKSTLSKSTLTNTFILFFISLFVMIACNRQVNDQVESTPIKESTLEKIQQNETDVDKDELVTPLKNQTTTTQTSPISQQPKYAFDEFYGEKHFTANYVLEYGRQFSELTFLIDTNYLEACPGHYSQIAYYATAPTKPDITYEQISGNGEISLMYGPEKSGKQSLGNFRIIPKTKDIGTQVFEIKASTGKKGKADYVEKTYQITIEVSCKNTCPPFTDKIIPSFYIPRILPYDVYVTSSENSKAASKKDKCLTEIDIAFKDPLNNAIDYQIFEGISPFIENPLSKQIYQNPTPVFIGTGNGQQSGLCNGNYYIELSDPTNGCRTHKSFQVQQGELISEDQHIFKTDTVYEKKHGKQYKIVNNPHPYIKYVKYGENNYLKILFNEDIAYKYKMEDEDVLVYIKELIDFNERYDSLVIKKKKTYTNIFVYHKGIRVLDYSFTRRGVILEGAYSNDLNVNTDNLISKEKAVEICKLKAIELGHELADSTDMKNHLKLLESRNKHTPHLAFLNTKIRFEIIKHNASFIPTYYFKLYNKNFFLNPVFVINAINGEIIDVDQDGLRKCKNCTGNDIVESDCTTSHPVNIDPSSILYACEFDDLETHTFDNFPDIYEGCSAIKSEFHKCLNFDNNLVQLSDINSKISSIKMNGSFEYISLDNDAYNSIELQQLTAYKNTEQVYEYNLKNMDNKAEFLDKMNIFISAGYLNEHGAYASTQSSTIIFGDGSDLNCMPNVSSDDVAHEFTHLVLGKIFNLSYDISIADDRFELLGVALHEAISDIMAVLFTYSKGNVLDWSVFEEDCDRFVRFLDDPTKSEPPQKILFGEELVPMGMAFDQYEWAGIISYWFYLMTEPEHKEINDVIIGEGIGAERAERLIFRTLSKIKEDITPQDSMYVNFEEFRDVTLSAADEIFNAPTPLRYNLCSPEYTKAYLAFQAVGLIKNNLPTPCALLNYDSNLTAECPPNGEGQGEYFCYEISPTEWQFVTGFPENFNFPEHTYWIQMAVDYNENGFFELEEYIDDSSMSFTKDILNHKVTLGDIPSAFTKIKLVVTDVTTLEDFDMTNDANLYSVEYIFTCNSGCSLLVSGGWDNSLPPANTGSISIFSEQNFEVCAGKTFCFDYAVSGPVYMYVDINGNNFTKTVNLSGANTNGQFCWQPTIQDLGINTFEIKASDKHPTQPLTRSKIVNIEVDTYNAGCLCAGQFADETVSLSSNIRSGHYVALKNLKSDASIFSSSDVLFKAGTSITLNDGFYVSPSSDFDASIGNCILPPIPTQDSGPP